MKLGKCKRQAVTEMIEEFAPIDQNEYTGKRATKSMLETVEPMKLVRPGILLEELKYIVYHDTGNAGSGADAKMQRAKILSNKNIFFILSPPNFSILDSAPTQG